MKIFSDRRDGTLTLDDLAKKTAAKYGVTITEAYKYARMFRDTMIECLLDGLSVKIREFGTFTIHSRHARDTECHLNGRVRKIHIPEKFRVVFVPSNDFTRKVDFAQKLRQ